MVLGILKRHLKTAPVVANNGLEGIEAAKAAAFDVCLMDMCVRCVRETFHGFPGQECTAAKKRFMFRVDVLQQRRPPGPTCII